MSRAIAGEQISAVSFEFVESCPVCSSPDHQNLYAVPDKLCELPGEFKVTRCCECGLVYLRERPDSRSMSFYYPDDSYYAYKPPARYSLFHREDRLAAIWYAIKKSVLAHNYNYSHLGGNRIISTLARLPLFGSIKRHATFKLDALLHPYVKGGSLLEVGCASGMYLDLMKALGWNRVAGVDTSRRAIEQAKGVLGLEAYCGELKDVRFDGESFDAVSLSHTLEHVSDVADFLRETNRVMKRNGRLAIIVPNIESLCARRFGKDWFHLDAPRHMVNFTCRSLQIALENAGFRVESLKTTSRMAYQTALFSSSRKAGDDRSIYTDANHRFPFKRRARSRLLSLVERIERMAGLPAGEEIIAVARKRARV